MSIKKASPQNTKGIDEMRLTALDIAKGVLGPAAHHAYCFVVNNPVKGVEIISEAVFSVWGISTEGNPDFFHYSKNSFVIDDAHIVRDWSVTKPVLESKKICCIETYSLTDESQNALLKLLESTPSNTFFIMVVPTKELFLPTLYSRLSTFQLETEAVTSVSVTSFLNSSIAKRGEMLKSTIENRDRGGAQVFLDLLELELYRYESEEGCKEIGFGDFLRTLPEIKKLNLDQRSSVKMLLEHVVHFAPSVGIENSRQQQ